MNQHIAVLHCPALLTVLLCPALVAAGATGCRAGHPSLQLPSQPGSVKACTCPYGGKHSRAEATQPRSSRRRAHGSVLRSSRHPSRCRQPGDRYAAVPLTDSLACSRYACSIAAPLVAACSCLHVAIDLHFEANVLRICASRVMLGDKVRETDHAK